MKLTMCGCNDCEEKALKLLKWCNEAMNSYATAQGAPKCAKCAKSLAMPNCPNKHQDL